MGLSVAPELAPDLLLPGQGPPGGSIPGLSMGLMRARDLQGFVLEWTVGHFEREASDQPFTFPFRAGLACLGSEIVCLRTARAWGHCVYCCRLGHFSSRVSLVTVCSLCIHTLAERRTLDGQREFFLALGELGEAGASRPPLPDSQSLAS